MSLFDKINLFYKLAQEYEKKSLFDFSRLEKYISDPENPKYFVHFSTVNRLGINPRSSFKTPLGVYGYPLTKEIYNQIINKTLPFAGDRLYIHIFKIKNNVVNMKYYTYQQLKTDTLTLKDQFNLNDDFVINAFKDAYLDIPIGKMWNLTRLISNNPIKWNKILRSLGYSNFYDPELGLIHSNEPNQIVVLDPTKLELIETIYNLDGSFEDLPEKERQMILKRQDQQKIDKVKNSLKNMSLEEQIDGINKNDELFYDLYHHLTQNQKLKLMMMPGLAFHRLKSLFKTLPTNYYKYLMEHPSVELRLLIIDYLPFDSSIFTNFIDDTNEEVRLFAAEKAGPEYIGYFINDPSPKIRELSAKTMNIKNIRYIRESAYFNQDENLQRIYQERSALDN